MSIEYIRIRLSYYIFSFRLMLYIPSRPTKSTHSCSARYTLYLSQCTQYVVQGIANSDVEMH